MAEEMPTSHLQFQVHTALGFTVRVTQRYWQIITTIKHPMMNGRETDVQAALQHPNIPAKSKRLVRILILQA